MAYKIHESEISLYKITPEVRRRYRYLSIHFSKANKTHWRFEIENHSQIREEGFLTIPRFGKTKNPSTLVRKRESGRPDRNPLLRRVVGLIIAGYDPIYKHLNAKINVSERG